MNGWMEFRDDRYVGNMRQKESGGDYLECFKGKHRPTISALTFFPFYPWPYPSFTQRLPSSLLPFYFIDNRFWKGVACLVGSSIVHRFS